MARWRILVVDDNEDTCDLIRLTLDESFDVLTVTNPLDVPQALDIFGPDLILLDVMMPKVSGFQLADYLKKNTRYSSIPIVFLSAKGAVKDQKYGYSLGAAMYLTKPFEPSRLIKNINVLLDGAGIQPGARQWPLEEVRTKLARFESCTISGKLTEAKPVENPDPIHEAGATWLD